MLGGGFLRNVLFLNHFVCFLFLDKALQRLFQGMPCVFQRDNEKSHTASITTAWLRSRRVQELNWPAWSPDLSNIENIWHIIKQKICQRQQSLQQLEAYIRQEWDQIPTPKIQKLITSMPRCLQAVLKRRGDATLGKHALAPTILRPVAGIKFEMSSCCA